LNGYKRKHRPKKQTSIQFELLKKAIHHIVSQNMYDLISIITPYNIFFIIILIQLEYQDYKYFTAYDEGVTINIQTVKTTSLFSHVPPFNICLTHSNRLTSKDYKIKLNKIK